MEYHKCKLKPLSSSSSSSFSSVEGIKNELSRNVSVRKRSRRFRRPESSWFGDQQHFHEMKTIKNDNESSTPEPVSSISYASPEEAVAYCLMMLSRDKWIDDEKQEIEEELVSDSESNESSDSELVTKVRRLPRRNYYKCQTCNKIFRSYQALGGHIASHKRIKPNNRFQYNKYHQTQVESKMHECHVCFKVFASGQALGGHKRSHASAKHVVKKSINLIDLNLPAPSDADVDYY
ncbi:zinc finger protein ZAT1-like [Bidens hawaiensis]|uniref:zinc finger protein ZAT1-like n=1 Tax=Bidens hawaiensis TaxID=980011 RepID=UPI004049361C